MAAALLHSLGAANVMVYDKGEGDGNGAQKSGWHLKNGFESYTERDECMVNDCSALIVYLFEDAVASGTWYNLMFAAGKAVASAHPTAPAADVARLVTQANLEVARATTRDTPFCDQSWEVRPAIALCYRGRRNFLYIPREKASS
jgi:hypothetical protein